MVVAQVPADRAQRLVSQLRSLPAGQGRTAAEVASGMVGMTEVQAMADLKELARDGLVLCSECPPVKGSKWRLG